MSSGSSSSVGSIQCLSARQAGGALPVTGLSLLRGLPVDVNAIAFQAQVRINSYREEDRAPTAIGGAVTAMLGAEQTKPSQAGFDHNRSHTTPAIRQPKARGRNEQIDSLALLDPGLSAASLSVYPTRDSRFPLFPSLPPGAPQQVIKWQGLFAVRRCFVPSHMFGN